MSEIARNYIITKEANKLAGAAFDAALIKQFGKRMRVRYELGKGEFWDPHPHSEYNEETLAAHKALEKAGDEAHRARSVAFQNGGDFALPIGEEHGHV